MTTGTAGGMSLARTEPIESVSDPLSGKPGGGYACAERPCTLKFDSAPMANVTRRSNVQLAAHPSPPIVLPSSHVSSPCTSISPHVCARSGAAMPNARAIPIAANSTRPLRFTMVGLVVSSAWFINATQQRCAPDENVLKLGLARAPMKRKGVLLTGWGRPRSPLSGTGPSFQGSGNGEVKFKGRSIVADASSGFLRQLGEKLLRAFLHLGRGQVFDVLRERPNVAEWV